MRRYLGRFFHSLPARLLGIFVVTALAFIIITSLMWGLALKHQWKTRIHPHIVQYVDYLNEDLGAPPDLDRARELSRRLPINIYVTGPDIEFSTNGEKISFDRIDFESRRRHPGGVNFEFGEHDDRTVIRTTSKEYTVFYELRHRDRFRRSKDRGRNDHGPGFLGIALLILLGVLLTCYWLIRRLIYPIRDIQAGVRAMGAGQLDYRIDVKRNDDLGELTSSINNMGSDIEQMLDAKRQLLLGISHELRSPITRARVSTELLPASDTRNQLEHDLQELDALITELLESERLNSRHAVLHASPLDIVALAQSVAADVFSNAVTVTADNDIPLVNVDDTRVRLLLRNLINNAIAHGGETIPRLSVLFDQNAGIVTFKLQDDGPGIKPEDIEKLTEPFYRVDSSRTRSTGGFGLGLYLCRLIAEAHGGELHIESAPGEGTTVRATLKNQPNDRLNDI